MDFFYLCRRIPVLLILFFCSCTKAKVNEAQLRAYLADPANGLTKEKAFGSTLFKVSYQPTDVLVMQDIDVKNVTNPKIVDSVRQNYSHLHYFLVNISHNGSSLETNAAIDRNGYESLLSYLNYEIANDVWLVSEADTIPVFGHVYANFYNTTATTNLLFAFENEKLRKSEQFSVLLKSEKLGLGRQIFSFESNDILNIPKLIF